MPKVAEVANVPKYINVVYIFRPPIQRPSGTLKILIVAEKNSIAGAISRALGRDIKFKKGRVHCFYFTGVYGGNKANFCVTATNGHIFNRDFPKEFADWVFNMGGEITFFLYRTEWTHKFFLELIR